MTYDLDEVRTAAREGRLRIGVMQEKQGEADPTFLLDHDPGFAYRKFQSEHIKRPCMDIDQIVLDEHYEPVAVIETTHCRTQVNNPRFLEACDARMDGHPQGNLAMQVANLLAVPAYWVAFDLAFENFAIRRLDSPGDWHFASRQQYIDWVHKLGSAR